MSKFANRFLKTLNEDCKDTAKKLLVKKQEKQKELKKKKPVLKEEFEAGSAHSDAGPDHPAPAPTAEPSDTDTWKGSLDKGTKPEDFDVADNPQHDVDTSGINAAREWISKLEHMAEFVNGTSSESLNSQINQLEIKNSIPFRGVVRREEKRITKLAENLRGLAEVFKSVVIGSHKKVKDATSPR